MSTKRALSIAWAVAASGLVFVDPAAAQNPRRAIDLGDIVDIVDWFKPKPKPPEVRLEYVVTEINPVTKGVQYTNRFPDERRALIARDLYRKAHYVQWRYLGINEPLRWKRFPNASAAQSFIDNNGPAQRGAISGIAILTNETRSIPARVAYVKETVRVQPGER